MENMMNIDYAECGECGRPLELVRPGKHQCNYCDRDGWTLVPLRVTPAIEAVYTNEKGAFQTPQELHDAMIKSAT